MSKLINSFYKDYKRLHSYLDDELKDRYLASRVLDKIIIYKFVKQNLSTNDKKYLEDLIENKSNIFDSICRFYDEPGQFHIKNIENITSIFCNNELDNQILVNDDTISKVFVALNKYTWNLDGVGDQNINPDVLGYVFEKYINQRDIGAYYTSVDTISYININTIIYALINKSSFCTQIKQSIITNIIGVETFEDLIKYNKMSINLFIEYIKNLKRVEIVKDIYDNLKEFTVIDICAGTGAFLLNAIDILESIYSTCYE